jgi:ubiquinone/menaquinone biosynthesis C-methylase UbiE
MKDYAVSKSIVMDKDLISVIDELPLWSAPFGLCLLDKIRIGRNLKVLDIGCGTGFPLIEIAQRLGDSSRVYGIDPWKDAINRAQIKIDTYGINNTVIVHGFAEKLPFANDFFDIIVSNNGINNVEDIKKTFAECSRVIKQNGQFLFTMNLDSSMLEFYNILKDELEKEKLKTAVEKLKSHIYEKRRPLNEIKELLNENGFNLDDISENKFYLRFADGSALFNHSFIKYWFLSNWHKIVEPKYIELIFNRVERRLNKYAEESGELKLTVPYVVINCSRL